MLLQSPTPVSGAAYVGAAASCVAARPTWSTGLPATLAYDARQLQLGARQLEGGCGNTAAAYQTRSRQACTAVHAGRAGRAGRRNVRSAAVAATRVYAA